MERKVPSAAKGWPWQRVFPAARRYVDAETGARRRHHIHPSLVQRAVTSAVHRSGIGKRATCHTFRHSFATHLLGHGENGRPTHLQGQYLAFIHAYTKLHREAPAESDIQRYFQVTPPSVHQMVLTLERRGFISREPGRSRSIRVLVLREELPDLE